MRFSLASVLLLIAAIAAIVATVTGSGGWRDLDFFPGLYLTMLTIGAVAVMYGPRKFRPALIGATIFGVLYFLGVLKVGFWDEGNVPFVTLQRNLFLGFKLYGVALLLSHWIVTISTPATKPNDK